ncbi:MAG: hypothetical protein GX905_04840 [Bacteroidales bacterium]|jgi:hypothetical protein|nr:hypothetical protein [Bacteroidales bacterium]
MAANYENLSFKTDYMLWDMFEGKYAPKKVNVFPSNDGKWNYTLLSCFINELGFFVKRGRRTFYERISPKGETIKKFIFEHKDFPNIQVIIQIVPFFSVEISTEYLKAAWEKKHLTFASNIGAGGKTKMKKDTKVHVFYETRIMDPKDGTKALFCHAPLLYYSDYDFSEIFRYFTKRILLMGIPNNDDTCSLFEYADIWLEKESKHVNSLEILEKKINGFIKLDVQPVTTKKRLISINIENVNHYIKSGVYISPWAKSLLEDKTITQGFLLDTTWKIMPYYVTSIIMISCYNIGIPIGFAFGHSEDKELYKNLLITIQEKTGIQFKHYPFESDQGSALKSICSELEITHLVCLRHLLVSLKYAEFVYEITMLLKSTSTFELSKAKEFVENRFKTIDSSKKDYLLKLLNKVGLTFDGSILSIKDQSRWQEVSMFERKLFKMPSTTNALESTHGHLNAQTPRRNNFYASIYRIVNAMMQKAQSIEGSIRKNYNRIKHDTLQFSKAQNDRMNSWIKYYSTTIDNCNCSENRLESAMLGVDLPCSHRVYLGASFPACPKIKPTVKRQWDKLEISFNHVLPDSAEGALSLIVQDINYAVKSIKRFSHYKDTAKIEEYVKSKYNVKEECYFILNIPVSVMQIITEGVGRFAAQREEEYRNKRIQKIETNK